MLQRCYQIIYRGRKRWPFPLFIFFQIRLTIVYDSLFIIADLFHAKKRMRFIYAVAFQKTFLYGEHLYVMKPMSVATSCSRTRRQREILGLGDTTCNVGTKRNCEHPFLPLVSQAHHQQTRTATLIKHFRISLLVFFKQAFLYRNNLHSASPFHQTKNGRYLTATFHFIQVDDILHLSPVAYGGHTYQSIIL